jgi:hypothetical protein
MSKRPRRKPATEKQLQYAFGRPPDLSKAYTPPPIAANGLPNGIGSRSAPLCLDGLPIVEVLVNRKDRKGSVTTHLQPRPIWTASEGGRTVRLKSRGALDAWISDYRARQGLVEKATVVPAAASPTRSVKYARVEPSVEHPLQPRDTNQIGGTVVETVIRQRVTVLTDAPPPPLPAPPTLPAPPPSKPPRAQGPNIVSRYDIFDDMYPRKPCKCGVGTSTELLAHSLHISPHMLLIDGHFF